MGYLALILGLFSLSTWAEPTLFSGNWNGKGTYILNGEISQCSQVHLVFSATENTFTFDSGNRVCDNHSEKFYEVKMSYKEGLLYFYGQVVGKYDGNTLEAYYRAPDGDSFRNWRMFMRREGKHLMYEESRTMDGEQTPMISFSGMLILSE